MSHRRAARERRQDHRGRVARRGRALHLQRAVRRRGGVAIDPDQQSLLDAALRAKGPAYRPRTRHRTTAGAPRYTNRLILESSPYLLQHAHNPVNWFPWGDEAFRVAEETGRPVLLSVGYSTCHWCHVMEEESFEDEEIAATLNDHYVAVKVDREERPDVDSVYMTAVQAFTERGGWPMTVWLTADRKPFLAGTYFPPRAGARGAQMGFLEILQEVARDFAADRNSLTLRAIEASFAVEQLLAVPTPGAAAGLAAVDDAVALAQRRFDPRWGGAQGAPKFPSNFPVRLLLRHHRRTGDARALDQAHLTLQRMAAGGMYDHVGGGFHRYSVDEQWLVPHFEKMLYDNALLVAAYLEGFQATGDPDLARVARETLDYVERDLGAPGGGFYSATDADSLGPGGEREEGYYFTWTPGEIETAVGRERARVLGEYYAVDGDGNFEGRNILHAPAPRDAVAERLGLSRGELDRAIAEGRELLREVRARRPAPLRDDKIQVSWNGLMVSALARGGLVLDQPRYTARAERAAEFLLGKLLPEGKLRHSLTDGALSPHAFADDYAFLATGLLDLFEATGSARWLSEAVALMDALEAEFLDREHGGYFLTPDGHERLLAREKPAYDGAIPSANSVALTAQVRLSALTDDDRWRQRAERTLRAFSPSVRERPYGFDEMLLGVDLLSGAIQQVAIVSPSAADARPLLDVVRSTFAPHRVLVVTSPEDAAGPLGDLLPWLRVLRPRDGQATAYVCEHGACALPTSDPAVLKQQLRPPANH